MEDNCIFVVSYIGCEGLKAINSADSPLTAYMYELCSFPS